MNKPARQIDIGSIGSILERITNPMFYDAVDYDDVPYRDIAYTDPLEEKTEGQEALLSMIPLLKVEEARMFVLYLLGYSADEMATVMGDSRRAVAGRFARMTDRMRTAPQLQHLMNHGEDL